MNKEFKGIYSAVNKWVKKNKGYVVFVGSFISFDEEKIKKDAKNIIKGNMIIGYGGKKEMKLSLASLQSELKKSKEDFINW
jgi:hypothetical protein